MSIRTFKILLLDFLSASLAWALFYIYRRVEIEQVEIVLDANFYKGIVLIPLFWIVLYTLQGTYLKIRYMYRTRIIALTLFASLLGTTMLFFFFILDDVVLTYTNYYRSFFILFLLHFLITSILRFIYISNNVRNIHNGKDGFRTLLLADEKEIFSLYKEVKDIPRSSILLVGYASEENRNIANLDYLGNLQMIPEIIANYDIEEVIISFHKKSEEVQFLISQLIGLGVIIKEKANMGDIISGYVKTTNIFGGLFNELNSHHLPFWQQVLKRGADIVLSVIALICLIPVFIVLACLVKGGSKGSIFFTQERIGLNGKVFSIIKFRTMYVDSERAGPQLSSENDPRITKVGRFMRKTRFDEFPQFYNVLKGDMSLVGPRPERQYFIDKIVARNPQYLELNAVRPGITSWGQVKFGYAENVDEMLQRMKYDLLYLKNRSLALDFKIMLYTVLIMVKAKGK